MVGEVDSRRSCLYSECSGLGARDHAGKPQVAVLAILLIARVLSDFKDDKMKIFGQVMIDAALSDCD